MPPLTSTVITMRAEVHSRENWFADLRSKRLKFSLDMVGSDGRGTPSGPDVGCGVLKAFNRRIAIGGVKHAIDRFPAGMHQLRQSSFCCAWVSVFIDALLGMTSLMALASTFARTPSSPKTLSSTGAARAQRSKRVQGADITPADPASCV